MYTDIKVLLDNLKLMEDRFDFLKLIANSSDTKLIKSIVRSISSVSSSISEDCTTIINRLNGTTTEISEQSKPESESAQIPGNAGE